jgi:hypothetical protein
MHIKLKRLRRSIMCILFSLRTLLFKLFSSFFFVFFFFLQEMSDENLTNLAKPSSDATITVRCIKNFEYRTCKNLVLQHVNLETSTVGDLKKLVLESKQTNFSLFVCFPPLLICCIIRDSHTAWMETLFKCQIWYCNGCDFLLVILLTTFLFIKIDTLKVYTVAHGHKVILTRFSYFFSFVTLTLFDRL